MWGHNVAHWANNLCGFGPSFGHGPWFLGWLFPLLFWGLIFFVVYSIAKSLSGSSKNRQEDSALEALRLRFASGEINEKEFTDLKAVLSDK